MDWWIDDNTQEVVKEEKEIKLEIKIWTEQQ